MELNWEGVVVGAGCLWSIRELKEQAKRVVSQKSKEKIADCRGSDQLPCGSLFLDRRSGVLYNCLIVSF